MSGATHEITGSKTAERNFQELADAMPQMVWTCGSDGKADYFNRQWYAYTGTSTVEEMNKSIHPDDLAEALRTWQQAVLASAPFECELRLKRGSDNSYRWHISRALPVKVAEGSAVRWFGTCTDIEDAKQTQVQLQLLNATLEQRVKERTAELAESELRQQLLVEGVTDYAILLLDSQGLVKSWNRGAEKLTGYIAADIVGRPFSILYNATSVSAGEPAIALTEARTGERSQREGWRLRQDGSEFWASVAMTAIWDSNGLLSGFALIIRDMTEQRRVEALLIGERKRAESASHAKSAFLASMSHEIRTPMNAILGMADMLWESELSQSQRHYVEIFRRAGGNLLALINDILDLSKIESGSFSLEEVQFSITTLIEQVIEILIPKAESKGISLRAQLAFPLAPPLVGDPARLQQILLNLLGNAIKFTDHGEVVLKVQLEMAERYATLRFQVCDTGIGIPGDKLEAIFEDFEQAEKSTTRRFGGTGLGLGISRRLVRRMRGDIRAESELGRGSTFSFHISLPIGVEQTEPEFTQFDDIAGKPVLIVDNNSTNRVILSEMCSAWGMEVSNCASGADAIELARKSREHQPFALALVDRMMPGMDGFETAGQIRSLDANTAIFIVSSDSQAGDIARCRELGLAGHLMKPVRRGELLEQISKALGRRSEYVSKPHGNSSSAITLGPLRRFQLLVAEDSEDNRFILQAYCQESPYELTFVEDGQKAVRAFSAGLFDLVVMDVQMPVMDGLTAARQIRTLEQGSSVARHTPILALTANALPEDIKHAREAGCDAHLSKPISKKNFLAALEQWLITPFVSEGKVGSIEIPEGLEELAPRYLAVRQRELAVLQDLLRQSDFEALRRLSHNIKGTGTSFGFPEITRLGTAIEQASKDCDLVELTHHISDLATYIDMASGQL